MKVSEDVDATLEPERARDITIPGGCLLCGGDLAVRVDDGDAASYCPACRWISRPHLKRVEGSIHVIHPAGGLA